MYDKKGVMEMFRMPKWRDVLAFVVLVLLIIGIIRAPFDNPWLLLLPILVFGGIFLLYKYPPSFLGGRKPVQRKTQSAPRKGSAARHRASDRPRAKTVPFRVIEGGKDDDNLPKYH